MIHSSLVCVVYGDGSGAPAPDLFSLARCTATSMRLRRFAAFAPRER
jgi:hypothetical protein